MSGKGANIIHGGLLTALCLNAETVFEALVWVGAGDDLWVGAAHVHIPLALYDVAAIALQPLDCRGHDNLLGCNLIWCASLFV